MATDNVVYIGDIQAKHAATGRNCRHRRLIYDSRNRVIECKDCERIIDAFDAFRSIVENFDRAQRRLNSEKKELEAEKEKNTHLLAARKAESAWRSRTTVPVCPHCRAAIFPDDGFGRNSVSKALAEARRKKVDKGEK